MTESFEDAFHQIDKDFDGVVTMEDLESYVAEKQLSRKFIDKWIRLFGDENQVIYYDNFCKTLGIVPKSKILESKTYRIDLKDPTKRVILSEVTKIIPKDSERIPQEDLLKLKEEIERNCGGVWNIETDKDEEYAKNIRYVDDGMIYYTPNAVTEEPKLLIYKTKNKKVDYTIYYENIGKKTKEEILELFEDEVDEDDVKDKVKEINEKVGGDWQVIYNPTKEDIKQPHEHDGIICFSNSNDGEPLILVFRQLEGVCYPCNIIRSDMTFGTQATVMKTTDSAIKEAIENSTFNDDSWAEKVAEVLSLKYTGLWYVGYEGNEENLPERYSEDGLLYYVPGRGNDKDFKVLIYKKYGVTGDEIIHEVDMSDAVKDGLLQMIHDKMDNCIDPKNQPIITHFLVKDLNDKYGEVWNMVINPTKKQLKINYDYDGMIYLTPNSLYDTKLLIWRKDKSKSRGYLCCC